MRNAHISQISTFVDLCLDISTCHGNISVLSHSNVDKTGTVLEHLMFHYEFQGRQLYQLSVFKEFDLHISYGLKSCS